MANRAALQAEVAETFSQFSGGAPTITPNTLEAAMAELERPVDSLKAQEMVAISAHAHDGPVHANEHGMSQEEFRTIMCGADAAVDVS